ncbi:MAG: hypothetical protein AB7S26_14305 [Sandaracinaceae bacterium]
MNADRIFLSIGLSLAALACDGPVDPPLDAGAPLARVTPRFELADAPMDFGVIPFPDDLYLDARGRVALGALPSEDLALPPEYPGTLRTALSDLDGFSVAAPVFFSFPPSSLDPASLPATASDTLREDSSVFLVDADPASVDAFRRLPVRVSYVPELGQLALRPADGHPLTPGRRYAAVVTTGVRDDRGDPIGPHASFLAIRDAAARPDGAREGAAYDEYTPVLATLSSNGVLRSRVAALAVFTVQRVRDDMASVRATIHSGPAPVVSLDAAVASGPDLDALLGVPATPENGLDVDGGVLHDRIGWMVQGSFMAPWFTSDTLRVHGRFHYDASGGVTTSQSERVPFTLTVPAGSPAPWPVVVFCHGIGSERSAMLSIANTLAASGYATIAIDLPFHGMRASGTVVDANHNHGDTPGPDGFGDRGGNEVYLDYLGVQDAAGELTPFHPTYVRDVLRQSAADLMMAVRVVREGDWSAVQATPGLESLALSADPLGFVGVSLGGIVGTVFIANEPEIGASVLNVTGGDLTRLVERSVSFGPIFLPILLPKVGLDVTEVDYATYPPDFSPELAIVQTLLDRGDSIAFAPFLHNAPMDILFQMAHDDETVPNSATEGLARATGATLLDATPRYTDLPMASAPSAMNLELTTGRETRGLFVFAPATHGLLSARHSESVVVPPPEPPFEYRTPVPVMNPVDDALTQLAHFFDSWRAGSAEIIAP